MSWQIVVSALRMCCQLSWRSIAVDFVGPLRACVLEVNIDIKTILVLCPERGSALGHSCIAVIAATSDHYKYLGMFNPSPWRPLPK